MGKVAGESRLGVLVVDDHELVRQGMAQMIENTSFLKVIGEAADLKDAISILQGCEPAVAVIDLSLKNGDGFELIAMISSGYPDVKIVVSSMHEDAVHVERSLRVGAHGYVAKSAPSDTLIEAIQSVLDGKIFLPNELSERVLRRLKEAEVEASSLGSLSEREREVFGLVGEGLTAARIAERLNRSPKTIETHIARMKEKLGVTSAHELYRTAFLAGMEDDS